MGKTTKCHEQYADFVVFPFWDSFRIQGIVLFLLLFLETFGLLDQVPSKLSVYPWKIYPPDDPPLENAVGEDDFDLNLERILQRIRFQHQLVYKCVFVCRKINKCTNTKTIICWYLILTLGEFSSTNLFLFVCTQIHKYINTQLHKYSKCVDICEDDFDLKLERIFQRIALQHQLVNHL